MSSASFNIRVPMSLRPGVQASALEALDSIANEARAYSDGTLQLNPGEFVLNDDDYGTDDEAGYFGDDLPSNNDSINAQ